jgi:hypothetical protein
MSSDKSRENDVPTDNNIESIIVECRPFYQNISKLCFIIIQILNKTMTIIMKKKLAAQPLEKD